MRGWHVEGEGHDGPGEPGQRPWVVRVLLAGQGVALLLAAVAVGGYGWDDGAITLSFARTFAQTGRIAVTPESEAVEGFSSPAWFALNSLLALGRPGFFGALFGAQFMTLVTVVASTLMLGRLGRAAGLSPVSRLGVMAIFAFMGQGYAETVNGMEMGLLALCSLIVVHFLYFEQRPVLLGVALVAFVATRFEALFYLFFMLQPLLWRRRVREFGLWAGLAGVAFLGIAATRWLWFKDILPNTVRAKMHAPYTAGPLPPGLRLSAGLEVLEFFSLALLVMVACLVCLWARRIAWERPRGLGPLAAPILGGVSFALVTGPNWGYPGRMQFFTIPFVLLLLGKAIDGLTAARVRWRPALLAIVGLLTIWSARVSLPVHSLRLAGSGGFGVTPISFRETGQAVEAIRQAARLPVIVFLTPDVGGTALCCPRIRVVDLAMLTNRRLAVHGYEVLPEVIEGERPEVVEVHAPWGGVSGLYGLSSFREAYVPALVSGIRLYLRGDLAAALVGRGEAGWVEVDGPASRSSVVLRHRYAAYVDAADEAAFLSRGRVLLIP